MPHKTTKVSYLTVNANEDGQRLDNFLMAKLKGLPRSRVYRIIRSGEVRVNKGRVKPSSRLQQGDQVRVPPMTLAEPGQPQWPAAVNELVANAVIELTHDVLVLNKPAGLAVHSGSGVNYGVIDVVKQLYGSQWQLVHRLDRETSGVLLLVARRELQHQFQQAQADGSIEKHYQALVHGQWPAGLQRIESELGREQDSSGQRRVSSRDGGQTAVSEFELERSLYRASLLNVRIYTGRTHQIRVQAAEAGHPLIGDSKYGRRELDRQLELPKRPGLCLHARRLALPLEGELRVWECDLAPEMRATMDALEPHHRADQAQAD